MIHIEAEFGLISTCGEDVSLPDRIEAIEAWHPCDGANRGDGGELYCAACERDAMLEGRRPACIQTVGDDGCERVYLTLQRHGWFAQTEAPAPCS